MKPFLMVFFGFWAVWLLWYVTGGPLRDDTTKPFIQLNESGQLESAGTSTEQ